ncbi:alpha/beta hydrolase family protein [bacterium BMS3Bbin12]|nr:alpha/beta hydrolase family protein [bacterium BMS3Bbin12]GBE49557.1 alpha/beta hydrolase family protein [bacterium BMS3Bbin13]
MVVLLHGLFLSGWVMVRLARRLRRCGLRTAIFSYPTRRRSPADNARDLAAFLVRLSVPRVDLVAHSLGSLVVLHLLAGQSGLRADTGSGPRVRRVVLLGPPLGGSVVARRLTRRAPGRWLLGRSVEQGLLGDGPAVPPDVDLAVIAGSRGWGIGWLFGGLPRPNDGTVAVAETRTPNCRQHTVLPVSHMGLVFSPRVARRICRFLRHGELEAAGRASPALRDRGRGGTR